MNYKIKKKIKKIIKNSIKTKRIDLLFSVLDKNKKKIKQKKSNRIKRKINLILNRDKGI
ncbi:hypothetical protein [Candidatus Vidania fulgoroideorum]